MKKSELAAAAAEAAQITKKDAGVCVDAVLNAIAEALAAGDKVQIPGFGAFEVRTREARNGVNPQTGERLEIPPRKVPAFKPGKQLREQVEGR